MQAPLERTPAEYVVPFTGSVKEPSKISTNLNTPLHTLVAVREGE
jgi:hypothetical protein